MIICIGIELVISPESRLLPVGTNATFTCQFRYVRDTDDVFWIVNTVEANNPGNKNHLMNQGFTVFKEESDGIATLTLTVNGRHPQINNTHLWCTAVRNYEHGQPAPNVHSQPATILTIAGKLI